MPSSGSGQGRRGPRGSKAQIEAVRRSAEKAGKELDREQEESVGQLAKALGQITEGEALAHLDTRLAFLERQVERLSARREEADRGIQGELAVMRARIDDALEAVAATSQDQKETLASQQKRFSQLILESEHRSSSVSETLRQELVSKVQDSLTRLEKYEARLRGEIRAFEEGATERARAVSETLAKSREELELRVEEAVEDISGNLDHSSKDILSKLRETTADLTGLVEKTSEDLKGHVEQSVEELSKRLESEVAEATTEARSKVTELTASLENRVLEKTGEVDEKLSDALRELSNTSLTSEHRLSQLEESVISKLETEKREAEARFSELVAEVKIETQRLKEVIEGSKEFVDETSDRIKRELLMRIQSAEEKAGNGLVRVESFFTQLRKELASGEEEWSERLKESDEVIASLLVRVEELLGRVSSSEAKVATDRGSIQAHIQSIAGRVDHMEERIREAVEEVNAKHATKLEMLGSQLSSVAQSEVNAEEKLGAVDYLKRRVAEMSEQLDEIMVKVNAIGRYMTKPQNAQKLGLPFIPPEVAERINAIEGAIAELAPRPTPSSTAAVPKEVAQRLQNLERTVAALSAGIVNVDKPRPAEEAVREKLGRQQSAPQPPAAEKAQERAGRQTPWGAQTILPQKRRR